MVLGDVGRRLGLPVLWPGGEARKGPVRELACIARSHQDRASIAAFLRDHGDRSLHVSMISPDVPPEELDVRLEVAGIDADVELSALSRRLGLWPWQRASTRGHALDLLVLARVPSAVLAGAPWPAPVLVLAPLAPSRHVAGGAIDLADLADDRGSLRVRVDAVGPLGDLAPVADEEVAFVAAGRVVATALTTSAGEVEIASGENAHSLGVFRPGDEPPADPLAAIELRIAVLGPSDRALVLVDAELPDEALGAKKVEAAARGAELLAVRMRPTRSCRSVRERLRALGLPGRVLDARAVLDEGEALDVSEKNDPVRLARVAERLRRAGFAILHPEPPARAVPIAGNRVEV
jgi:hypothetical protein